MKIKTDTKPSCLRLFTQELTAFSLPTKLNFPFLYKVHPLCKLAANEVQTFLEEQKEFVHNFGLNITDNEVSIGKMFGVLVVEFQGSLGYIAAYSGKLANSNSVAFFVPPVFDMLKEKGYFLQKEEELNSINRQIEILENDTHFINLQQRLEVCKSNNDAAIFDKKKEIKEDKSRRKQIRMQQKSILSFEAYKSLEEELIKKSLADKRSLKYLIEQSQSEENKLVQEIHSHQKLIDDLKNSRKEESHALQVWLFENYIFLNAKNETKSLLDIFSSSRNLQPPAGAGECCAPKLFQYAYKNDLKPIVFAEFWWGQSPKSEVRKHGQFYPSCWGKCEPILEHMLQGLEVDENPFLINPAEGKDLPILYDDPYIVVVNKPAEFLSVPGIHVSDSVYERIKTRYPQATGPLIVHRLDMSTSGVMILAKNKEVHKILQKQFIKRRVEKTYLALLEGEIIKKEGVIELPLRVDLDDRPRQLVCETYGKPATTIYKVLSITNGTTKVKLVPITGRTHQLRVHTAHQNGLNAPIKGDDLYGNNSDRLYLHAFSLRFHHPITHKSMLIEAEADF